MAVLPYPYMANTNYPVDAAQNVPDVFYNTEGGFQWQNNRPNAPLVPNPPLGYAPGITAAANFPLFSAGYGGLNTGIAHDGVASAGTRIALFFAAATAHPAPTAIPRFAIVDPTVILVKAPAGYHTGPPDATVAPGCGVKMRSRRRRQFLGFVRADIDQLIPSECITKSSFNLAMPRRSQGACACLERLACDRSDIVEVCDARCRQSLVPPYSYLHGNRSDCCPDLGDDELAQISIRIIAA